MVLIKIDARNNRMCRSELRQCHLCLENAGRDLHQAPSCGAARAVSMCSSPCLSVCSTFHVPLRSRFFRVTDRALLSPAGQRQTPAQIGELTQSAWPLRSNELLAHTRPIIAAPNGPGNGSGMLVHRFGPICKR